MKIIGGTWSGRTLTTPKGTTTRPTTSLVRGALFNVCQGMIKGARVLDLFAGSGALGIEALSRGALEAIFIEREQRALEALRENIERFRLHKHTRLIAGDVFSLLRRLEGPFDLIMADPPYKEKIHEKLLAEIAERELLAAAGFLFIETPYPLELPAENGPLLRVDSRRYGKTVLHHFANTLGSTLKGVCARE